MCVYKRMLVVFGGFHDNARKAPKYFNDLHVFDMDSLTWARVDFPAVIIIPESRSGAAVPSRASPRSVAAGLGG